MIILPKKYVDKIDIVELEKRQLTNATQRKSVEEAYQEYKKNYEHFYSEKAIQYIEDNFFTGDVHSIKNFTGEETCVFSEFRNSIFNNEESSSIYIPLKHHVLEGIHIYMSIYSIGKNRYSQEDIDICSFIQPMLIDTFNSILLYNDMNALKHSFIAERHPSANKNIKEKCELSSSGDAFPTLDTIIIDHIKMAIAKANGKIAGPDGAANLLGLNTSTLWSKIRKYNIDPKTLTE